jgi:2-polyprenyl-3-methyl-5-hydroxy-6-metoxy-1,4-benzoquinol methylase
VALFEDFLMKCPVCGTESTQLLFRSENRHGRHLQEPHTEFNVYQCTGCGLLGLPEVETDESYYQVYYPQGYHSPTQIGLLGRAWERVSSFLVQHKVNFMKRYIQTPCKLLDVGCGTGGFLKQLDVGSFDAHGLEPVKEAVEAAQQAGLKVTQGNILTDALVPESYDVVTLWHVFEHIKDPATALNRIYSVLKPGGVLVMTMPNVNSMAAQLGGKYWFHLDSPRHLWLYNETNIRQLLSASNFRIKTCRYLPFEFPLDLFWSIKHSFLGKFILAFYPVLKLFDRQNMFIIARKTR